MSSSNPSPDLVIRISLVRDGSTLQEIDPPVWRTFHVSSSVSLELLHDKIIAPIMGWERNYHTYFFRAAPKKSDVIPDEQPPDDTYEMTMAKPMRISHSADEINVQISGDESFHRGPDSKRKCIHYAQDNSAAPDVMHFNNFVDVNYIRKPEDAVIGDLLKGVGDRCVYNYDLGDCWYHCLEVTKVIPVEEATGEVVILDGAGRCPDEDGGGSAAYQKDVLDLLLKKQHDPNNGKLAREYAHACFERRHSLNVMSPFRPEEFDISERKVALSLALELRNSTRDTTKVFCGPGKPVGIARVGQKHVVYKKEDDRYAHMGGYSTFNETLNVKPDPKSATLCYKCGNPHDLKACARCKCAFYCSRECQATHWQTSHKKKCKKEKAAYENYQNEIKTGKPDPNRFDHDGGMIAYKKYEQGKLRFKVGDCVECMIGEDKWGTGRIVKLYYRQPDWPANHPPAPYQIKLDRDTAKKMDIPFQYALIYAQWDDDYQIRLVASLRGGKK